MTARIKLGKQSLSLFGATAIALILSSCGGTPPAIPAPPTSGVAGYVGASSCGGMTGTALWNTAIVASFSNGATGTMNFGVNLSQLTGSVSFYLPDLAGTSSYTTQNTMASICLSTTSPSGTQSPGTYTGGYISANLYGSVPLSTIYTGYGTLPILGTGYGGTTTYAQVTGWVQGYVINGQFTGQAFVSIPSYNGYQAYLTN